MTDANTPTSPEPTPAVPTPAAAPVAPAAGSYAAPGTPVEGAPSAYAAPGAPVGDSSKAARNGFIFSILQFPVNILSTNIINGMAVGATVDSVGGILGVFVVSRIIVLALIVLGFIFSLKGLRETAGGARKGRGFAIAGIIIASIGVLFWIISLLGAAALFVL